MALSFTRAPTVAKGDPITSTQLAQLAKAFNDRLRSGVGDPTWRIHSLMQSGFARMINPLDEFTAQSEMDFFWYQQNVDPTNEWRPEGEAGFPAGFSVVNPIGLHVFGIAGVDEIDDGEEEAGEGIFSEATHVNAIPVGTAGMSPLNGWDLAKEQRGAVDPDSAVTPGTRAYQSPMLDLAARAIKFNYDGGPPQPAQVGLSWGSWMKPAGGGEPLLTKPQSRILRRMLNAFAREFRGSDGQRASDSYHLQEAFDCQTFFTRQYHMAPNFGVEGGGGVAAIYPKFTSAGVSAIGGLFKDQDGNPSRAWHAGFCMDSWKVQVSGATPGQPVSFVIRIGGVDFLEVNFTPDAGGYAADSITLPVAFLSKEDDPIVISCALTRPLPQGQFEIEFTELEARPPEISDLYAVLRCAAADLSNIPDGVGTLEDQARVISEEYFRTGCVVNPRSSAGLPDERVVINRNAVYDAARRFSQFVAETRRHEFVDYAVVGGKSILWFRREFGIGEGVKVKPYENLLNIKHAADQNGMTNEWVLDVELRPYDTETGDIFKPDAYTDIFKAINRCHFADPDIASRPPLLNHISRSQAPAYYPESPPGWNYTVVQSNEGTFNVNTISNGDPVRSEFRKQFYQSCRIYEPPVEVEKVELEGTAPDQLIKVTLTGRVHHCPSAPGSISRDRSTWDITALQNEPFRSTENGLREYLRQFNDGGAQCTRPAGNWANQPGNSSGNATIWDTSIRPYGACYPLFKWTKLIPFAYDDGNDAQNPEDTHFRHDPFAQMEFYLRAMCEGFVDAKSSKDDACATGKPSLYDFAFEDLCFQAFGNDHISVLPGFVDGHGPLPNTDALAAVFNQFSAAINMLTEVRVMLPVILQVRSAGLEVLVPTELLSGDGSPTDCGDTVNAWGHYSPSDPTAPVFTDDMWAAGNSVEAHHDIKIAEGCTGGLFNVAETTQTAQMRFLLADLDVTLAIPESWRDMFDTHQKVLCRRTQTNQRTTHRVTTSYAEATGCRAPVDEGPAFPTQPPPAEEWLVFDDVQDPPEVECEFFGGMVTLNPPSAGDTDLFRTRDHGGGPCTSGGASAKVTLEILGGIIPTVSFPLADP